MPGEMVCIKLRDKDTWSPGPCTEKLENTSYMYMIKVSDRVYRRKSRHIQKTNEPPIIVHPEADKFLPTLPEDNLATPSDPTSEVPVTDMKKTLFSEGLVVSAEHRFNTRTM